MFCSYRRNPCHNDCPLASGFAMYHGEEIKNESANDRPQKRSIEGGELVTNRRNFLKGAAATGIAFCSYGMLHTAPPQPRAPRLPLKVNATHFLTVDLHPHCYFH